MVIPRAPRLPSVGVHRVTALDPADITTARSIPCTRPARTLIDLAGAIAPATLEVALDDLLSRRLVTVPRTQYEVVLPGGRRVVLDYAFPEVLLALEADSYRHHSSRIDWSRDRTRNRLLTAIGWRILPVTWDDLAEPAEMIDAVGRGLRQKPRSVG